MQIKVLATGIAPDYYELAGETVTAHVGAESDNYDLSVLAEGDSVTDVSPVGGVTPIRSATRENGVLKVVLCQKVGAGHWSESDWIDASAYDPEGLNVVFDETKVFAGTPVFHTRQGPMTFSEPQEA
ncbi:hypothetical protein DFO67_108141 [Modicisalibacter xianhensis]|uniref:Uncharacterized protein n=1 Tax=Modicisalibacter xianhensis TaxID=442341 RepID=A0A4R8FUB0_9GAMM|nr:hypothetical protein [Halomonas xianhensis]TDX29097.1 hypothetical protein DFO67_108141 [Halomonas xianhensis]